MLILCKVKNCDLFHQRIGTIRGFVYPELEQAFAAADVEAAFAVLASNQVAGKLVLVIDESLV